ncbi:MAG TPA: iron-sulfur cluster assembly scaffold protein [bacterium]|nr:iron-sulfur cluster assembly scaffold protein [bacterium]
MAKKEAETFAGYPADVVTLINDQRHFGRMNDPTGSSYLRGLCGDEMEFYLVIEGGKITDVRYYTEGCSATRACAAMAAKLAGGRTVPEALSISAGEIIRQLRGLPDDHLHCSILAVSTLYRAIADYLLKP